MLRFYNSLTKETEEFKPIKNGHVGMYNCGPTVYDRAHIGNLRAYVITDILRRVLEIHGLEVNQVMNITDLGHLQSDGDEGEDKMTLALKRDGLPLTLEAMKEVGEKYTKLFLEDLEKMNILTPTSLPKASGHIPEQIEIIEGLEKKGFIYTTGDGVYFDTSKDPHYGKLGQLSDNAESRIESNSEKRSPRDFALWKFNTSLGYESPWGKGFPGWHIECSAMSMKYLGESFDIHTGGVDHIPIHHNNEIAQSENYTGKLFAHYWIHNEHLMVDGGKMSKSKNDFYTLSDIETKGFSPSDLRYFFLQAHYKSTQNFTWGALDAAHNALARLKERVQDFSNSESSLPNSLYKERFLETVSNDLDTPNAVAFMWDMLKDDTLSDGEKLGTLLYFDQILGLDLLEIDTSIPEHVAKLLEVREHSRAQKDFETADEIRKKIEEEGFVIKDTNTGARLVKKN